MFKKKFLWPALWDNVRTKILEKLVAVASQLPVRLTIQLYVLGGGLEING